MEIEINGGREFARQWFVEIANKLINIYVNEGFGALALAVQNGTDHSDLEFSQRFIPLYGEVTHLKHLLASADDVTTNTILGLPEVGYFTLDQLNEALIKTLRNILTEKSMSDQTLRAEVILFGMDDEVTNDNKYRALALNELIEILKTRATRAYEKLLYQNGHLPVA